MKTLNVSLLKLLDDFINEKGSSRRLRLSQRGRDAQRTFAEGEYLPHEVCSARGDGNA